jgi:hypothetical protein
VAAEADQRGKLERLCRYISRRAVAIERLSRTPEARARRTWPSRAGQFEPQARLDELGAASETGAASVILRNLAAYPQRIGLINALR